MDLNTILLWFVIPVAVINISRLAKYAGQWAEISLFAIILAVTGIMLLVKPEYAGYAGMFLFSLIILTGFGVQRVQKLIIQQKYAEAEKTAQFIRWLRPTPAMWTFPKLLQALAAGSRGDTQAATELLTHYRSSQSPLARTYTAQLFRVRGDWAGLLDWIKSEQIDPAKNLEIMFLTLRALGETGQLNALAACYHQWQRALSVSPVVINLARLYLLAFAGRTEGVRMLFAGRLSQYPPTVKNFWLATAELAAGNADSGLNLLRQIETADKMSQTAAQLRLAQPMPLAAEVMSPETKNIIADLERTMHDEVRYGNTNVWRAGRAYATYGLIGANCAMFIVEIINGGSDNSETIYNLGGLVTSDVLAGEWWRVVTALFLHFGFLHLAMNMLALYLLGPFVENTLGRWKYLVAYLGAGFGSMLFIVGVAKMGWNREEMVIGASGAIMGIIGTTGAIMLLARKSKVAAQRLKSVVFIVVLQAVFDQATPNVSALGHASGLVIGFLLGLWLARNQATPA